MPALPREAFWAKERLAGDLRQSVPPKRPRPFARCGVLADVPLYHGGGVYCLSCMPLSRSDKSPWHLERRIPVIVVSCSQICDPLLTLHGALRGVTER